MSACIARSSRTCDRLQTGAASNANWIGFVMTLTRYARHEALEMQTPGKRL